MEKWDPQTLGLVLSALNNALTAVAIFVPIALYRLSRKRRLRIQSALVLENGAAVAAVKATNMETPRVGIENVALSLTVWDSRPRLQGWFLRVLRYIDLLRDPQAFERYASDAARIRICPSLGEALSEHESVEAAFSLDAMMEEFFQRGGILGSTVLFDLLMLFLRIEIVTPAGVYTKRAHREIRAYLWKRYRRDPRLLGAV